MDQKKLNPLENIKNFIKNKSFKQLILVILLKKNVKNQHNNPFRYNRLLKLKLGCGYAWYTIHNKIFSVFLFKESCKVIARNACYYTGEEEAFTLHLDCHCQLKKKTLKNSNFFNLRKEMENGTKVIFLNSIPWKLFPVSHYLTKMQFEAV